MAIDTGRVECQGRPPSDPDADARAELIAQAIEDAADTLQGTIIGVFVLAWISLFMLPPLVIWALG